jgi:diguanylate cyclase (GGDEF)-like protein
MHCGRTNGRRGQPNGPAAGEIMGAQSLVIAAAFYCLVLGVTVVVLRRVYARDRRAQAIVPVEKGDSASVKYLKDRCRLLEQRDIQRKVYLELTKVLSTATTFDGLVRGTVDALCQQLGSGHGALLWVQPGQESLEFKYAKGYDMGGDVVRVPLRASIAGSSILHREPVFVTNPRQQVQYVPIRSVVETNLLCAPIKLFNEYRGVLRLANIDTATIGSSEIESTFAHLTPLLSSALEKVLISQQSERRKNELLAISGVTQALNRTLDVREICAACARHLKPVFNYSYFVVLRFTPEDNITPIVSIPREIRFNESEASSRIILRNICSRKEPVLIEDVRRSENVDCQNREIGTLMSMPITIGGQPFGSIVVAAETGKTFDSDDMNVLAVLSEHLSVTIERAAYFRKQEEHATRDGLTGLYNHRAFQERLRLELQRFLRYKRPCSIAMVDIDHFKKFNDTYGHQTGDVVLKAVAECIRRTIRTTDTVFRYGGEEMTIVLPETELAQASLFANRLCALVGAEMVPTANGDLHVTVSIGVAQANPSCSDAEALVEAADKAMYAAKEGGRNRVCVSRVGEAETGKRSK